ncbi:MAG: glycosyltransferase [Chitinophagales bacterium]
MPNETTIVSVILPNYNHALFLSKRIDSILAQTYQNFELIILDDCSTDNSCEIIEDYCAKFPEKITFIQNGTNSGSPFVQWNKGAAIAKGEYIWIAESDDFCEPDLLEKSVAILEKNANVGLVYCNSKRIDENEQVFGFTADWTKNEKELDWENGFVAEGKIFVQAYLARACIISNASAVVFRKNIFIQIGKADTTFKMSADWLTWIKMLAISDVAYIAQALNYHRKHQNTVRASHRYSETEMVEIFRIYTFVKQHFVFMEIQQKKLRKAFVKRWKKNVPFFTSANIRLMKMAWYIDKKLVFIYGKKFFT